jgi:AcrR family transcriptional regulator
VHVSYYPSDRSGFLLGLRGASALARKPPTEPRKRPQQSRSQDTVEAILTAAARILVREGYARASTNRIAEVAGVGIGSLYEYFPNKDAIVATLRQRQHERMKREMSAVFTEAIELPLRAAVRRTIEVMVEAHAVDPALQAALLWQVPEHVSGPSRPLEHRFVELTKRFLEAHRAEVRPADLELAAFFAVQAIQSLTHAAWLAFPERLRDGRLIDEMTDLILRYLATD